MDDHWIVTVWIEHAEFQRRPVPSGPSKQEQVIVDVLVGDPPSCVAHGVPDVSIGDAVFSCWLTNAHADNIACQHVSGSRPSRTHPLLAARGSVSRLNPQHPGGALAEIAALASGHDRAAAPAIKIIEGVPVSAGCGMPARALSSGRTSSPTSASPPPPRRPARPPHRPPATAMPACRRGPRYGRRADGGRRSPLVNLSCA